MVEAASSSTTCGTCARCGQIYRSPQWGRAYACPACAEPLQSSASPPASFRLPKWLFGVAGIAVFTGCVLALAVARSKDSGPRVAPSTFLSPPPSLAVSAAVSQPPEIVSRFREKIRYFEADLRLEPKNEALLVRLAQTYASLALALREKQPVEAQKAINRARSIAQRRAQAHPQAFPPLDWVYQDPALLSWATEGSGLMLSQMMGATSGSGIGRSSMMNAPGGVRPNSSFPTQAPPLSGPGGPGAPPATTPGPPPILAPAGPTRLDQEKYLRVAVAAGITRRRENPNDLINLASLGTAYQRMADLEQDPRKRKSSANLNLALEVFRDAARRSRLRIYKASFFKAAGDVYGALGDTMNQYRMAKLASEQTPFSPSVWEELQDAALRVGRFADSRTAARNARDWRLPTIRDAELASGQSSGTGVGPAAGPPPR